VIGVVLMNLGGPETLEDIESFLYNLFSDRDVIRLMGIGFLQRPLAKLIARRRVDYVRPQYAAIGGGSPLRRLTEAQASALEESLGSGYRVAVAMRHAQPDSDVALRRLVTDAVRRVVGLSCYPQYSRATSFSSMKALRTAAEATGAQMRLSFIDRYHDDPGYLDAVAAKVSAGLDGFPAARREHVTVLFSAHGLPEELVKQGDPYPEHVAITVKGVRERVGLDQPWKLAFQSKVGRAKWIEPYTNTTIEELGRAGCRELLVVPIAFVSDHIETLYEIDVTFKELAARHGIVDFRRSESLNSDPRFIEALAALVRRHVAETGA
jgi:ferrochelatase